MKKLILSIAILTGFTGLNAGIFTSRAEKEAQAKRALKVKELKDLIDRTIKRCEPKASARTFLYFRIDDCLKLRAEQCDICLEKVEKMLENDIEKTSIWDGFGSVCPQKINSQSLSEFDTWVKGQPKQPERHRRK
jgi:hypothetical protein